MVSSIYLESSNEEMGKSLTITDSDEVELDDNTIPYNASPDVTRPLKTDKHQHLASNCLQEEYKNLTDEKGKLECYEADSGTNGDAGFGKSNDLGRTDWSTFVMNSSQEWNNVLNGMSKQQWETWWDMEHSTKSKRENWVRREKATKW